MRAVLFTEKAVAGEVGGDGVADELLGLPISALWAIATPASQALITQQIEPDMQGRIQGAMSGLVSLGGIAAPLLYTGAFGYFIGPHAPMRFPGISFLIAAALLACAVLVAWRYARPAPAGVQTAVQTEPA